MTEQEFIKTIGTKPQWISLKEHIPDPNTEVIVFSPKYGILMRAKIQQHVGGVLVNGQYNKVVLFPCFKVKPNKLFKEFWGDEIRPLTIDSSDVTHWMSMIPPPAEIEDK